MLVNPLVWHEPISTCAIFRSAVTYRLIKLRFLNRLSRVLVSHHSRGDSYRGRNNEGSFQAAKDLRFTNGVDCRYRFNPVFGFR
jgi:hypothetical protein